MQTLIFFTDTSGCYSGIIISFRNSLPSRCLFHHLTNLRLEDSAKIVVHLRIAFILGLLQTVGKGQKQHNNEIERNLLLLIGMCPIDVLFRRC